MPTARFVVVSAPLEERVAASLASQLHDVVAQALRLKREVNVTLHRDDLHDKTAEALTHVTEVGGAPFILFMLLVAVLALRELLLRIETKRIMRVHEYSSDADVRAPLDRKHED